MLNVAFDEFRKGEEVMADTAMVKRMETEGKGKNAKLVKAVKAMWGMYALRRRRGYSLSHWKASRR